MNKIEHAINVISNAYPKEMHLLIPRLASSHINEHKRFILGRSYSYTGYLLKYFFLGLLGAGKRYEKGVSASKYLYIGNPIKLKNEINELHKLYPNEAFIANDKNEETEDFSKIERIFYLNDAHEKYLNPSIVRFTIIILAKVFINLIKSPKDFKVHLYALSSISYYRLELALCDALAVDRNARLLNLFSGTQEGAVINHVFQRNSASIYTYSWGSNLKSIEQKHINSDVYLLKNGDPLNLYQEQRSLYIKEIGLSTITKNNTKYDCCIIDTCENDQLNSRVKIDILNQLNLSGLSVIYAWHPGTTDRTSLQNQFKKFTFSSNTIDAICESDIIVDFHSTLQSTLNNSKIEYISLAGYIYSRIYNRALPEYFHRDFAFLPSTLNSAISDFETFRTSELISNKQIGCHPNIKDVF